VKEHHKIALIQPSYLDSEHKLPLPCIRVAVNRLLTYKEIDSIADAIEDACNALNIFQSITSAIGDEHEEMRNQMIKEYNEYLKQVDNDKKGKSGKEALEQEEDDDFQPFEKADDASDSDAEWRWSY